MKFRPHRLGLAAALIVVSLGALAASGTQTKPASPATLAAQTRMRDALPKDDGRDDEFVRHGFIATRKDPKIMAEDGRVVWDLSMFDWVQGDAPPTVNPGLWRQMKMLKVHGLFQVAEGVYQVRNFDVANMTVIRGATGWIIVDPLMTKETAAAALALVNEHLGKRPVTGVIYSHSHPDHFGGVRGLIQEGADGKVGVPVLAPEHFVKEATSEFVLAGNAMSRRTIYQFGMSLKPGPQGSIGTGLATVPSLGTVTLIPPNDTVKHTGETRTIDGVTIEFQMVPETEAPSEMNLFLPAQRTFFVSEIATCAMHNVQTPRGALVRDANKWAGFLTEALSLYGDRSDAIMQGHCWPRFGNDVVKHYLALQRDNYKFIHDQAVRRFNSGETPTEIAENLKRPAAIENEWSNRGYYGTVKHNAKGIYQRYIGWWDGIPAHLNLYPPAEQGKRYVRAMGGAKGVINEAKRAMQEGDYRWSADILNHLVFAEPANTQAKALLADSYEQMGYQAESANMRNIYLTGAQELRDGVQPRQFLKTPSADLVAAMPTDTLLDLVAARLNPDRIGNRALTVNIDVTNRNEKILVGVRNAVMVTQMGKSAEQATTSISATSAQLMALFLRRTPLDTLEAAGVKVTGDRAALAALQDAIEAPATDFAIVTP